jgi:hypothetical protein
VSDATITWTGTVAGIVYITLMVAALLVTRGDASLRRLGLGLRLYGWAIASTVVALVAKIATGQWFWAAVSVAEIAVVAYCIYVLRQRRTLKAERVLADAERAVRAWRGDLW